MKKKSARIPSQDRVLLQIDTYDKSTRIAKDLMNDSRPVERTLRDYVMPDSDPAAGSGLELTQTTFVFQMCGYESRCSHKDYEGAVDIVCDIKMLEWMTVTLSSRGVSRVLYTQQTKLMKMGSQGCPAKDCLNQPIFPEYIGLFTSHRPPSTWLQLSS